jgi:hypothetical protein
MLRHPNTKCITRGYNIRRIRIVAIMPDIKGERTERHQFLQRTNCSLHRDDLPATASRYEAIVARRRKFEARSGLMRDAMLPAHCEARTMKPLTLSPDL